MHGSMPRLPLAWVLLAMMPAVLQAQTIYRCGNTYGQTPCTNGIVVSADDSRTPAQKAQTDAATTQATRLARQMEQDRLADERRARAATMAPAKAKPTRAPAAAPAVAKATKPKAGRTSTSTTKTPDPFTAAMPAQDNKKKTSAAPARN